MSDNPRVAEIISAILRGRGISEAQQEHFLAPDFVRDQHDASLMQGMHEAVQRLGEAVKKQEKVAVFGDYDADGVPATALLVRCFARLGLTIIPLIPSRTDGYGLSETTVKPILELHPDVLITVDNGTVAKEEIATLADAGIDVIVIDHHEPQEGRLADRALALINPKQPGCPYPFKELCGCGLAWKVMEQLYEALGEEPSCLKWELDLVALSTVADMVPLLGENRVFVTFGLKVLRKSRNRGLQALAAVAGIKLEECSPGDIGFRLAPRINAPSRMHQEVLDGDNAALRLLITDDLVEATRLAAHLNAQNAERQQLVESHLQEAERQAALYGEMRSLVVYHESWSSGVIGLVASKLMERYQRPVVALAPEGKEIKGSVRTVDGVHALDLLKPAEGLLTRFGGHAKAAGLTLAGDIATFRNLLDANLVAQGHTMEALALAAQRKPDYALPLAEVTLELADAITKLEPFGVGFPQPLFSTICTVTNIRKVGANQQHLSCFLTDNDIQKKAVAFGRAYWNVEPQKDYNVSFTLGKETWREVTAPVCYLQYLR